MKALQKGCAASTRSGAARQARALPRAKGSKEQAPRVALGVKSNEDPYTRLAALINPQAASDGGESENASGVSSGRVPVEEEAEAGRLLYMAGLGDEAAFTKLVSRYRRLMVSAALRVLHNLADAEDAVQDAVLTLWQKCREYKVENAVGFLVGMARGAALNIILRRRAAKRGGPKPEVHSAELCQRLHGVYTYQRGQLELRALERAPDLDPLRKMGQVYRLIGQVPPVFVGVLDAFFFQGKDEKNIAAERGETPNGVLHQLHEGLEVIRYLAGKEEAHVS